MVLVARHPKPMETNRGRRVFAGLLILPIALGLVLGLAGGNVLGDDWPTYRHDAARSGITAEQLEPPLAQCWVFRARLAPQPAWGDPKPEPVEGYRELRRIHFDDVYQVVAAGNGVYFGSSADNKVYCLDAASGRIRWTKITGGPVRLAPAVAGGRVYAGSDDGWAYCLNAADGSPVWKFRAAPENRRVLGNGKMISLWPLRSGVLVDGDRAYLSAGIFPAEGVFFHALDATSGRKVWCNDTTGEDSQSRISPQGYLLASKSMLYAPMGRVSPAAFDRKTGEFKFSTYFGKAVGGTYALLADGQMFTGTEQMVGYDGTTRDRFAAFAGRKLVVTHQVAYVAEDARLVALDRKAFPPAGRRLESARSRKDTLARSIRGAPSEAQKKQLAELDAQVVQAEQAFAKTQLWQLPSDCHEELVLAGNVLYAGGQNRLIAVDASHGKQLWEAKIEGKAKGLAVAGGKLLASTDRGLIYCFAKPDQPKHPDVTQPVDDNPFGDSPFGGQMAKAAEQILQRTGISRGYCLVLGLQTGQLALELAKRSDLTIYAVDDDAETVVAARRAIDAAGLYGNRICVDRWPLDAVPYADYFADLIVSERLLAGGSLDLEPESVLRMLKPLGGTVLTKLGPNAAGDLQEARDWLGESDFARQFQPAVNGSWLKITRGAIPGGGKWTHLYGNAGNSGSGDDRAVKCPLGVLWFGRPGPGEMVNRHRRAASPLAIDGRLFVQGENVVMAYDMYNGLKLWERHIKGAIRANASHDGSNLALNSGSLFVAIGGECLRLDPATGKTAATYPLPGKDNASRRWGYTATAGDLLYGSRMVGGYASDRLFAIDYRNGQTRWTYDGKHIGNNAIAIGNDTLYLVDTDVTPEQRQAAIEAQRQRIAALSGDQRQAAEKALEKADIRKVVALDARTGQVRWQQPVDVTHCGGGTLSLIQSGDALVIFGVYLDGHLWKQFFAGDFASRRVTVLSAKDGKFLWSKAVGYRVRPLVIGDTLHTEPWAFDLYSGKEKTRVNPFTGQVDRWQFARSGHHCGLPIGSPNCLFFRSYNLGYYDLVHDDGTRHFGGQRPGCWINFIPAGGLVLMPEASAGCMCPFPNMCSVVFQPTQQAKAYTQYSSPGPMTPVKRLGINLGAAGDRSDSRGNLWLSFPRPFHGRLVTSLDLPRAFYAGGKFTRRNSTYTAISGSHDGWLFTSAAYGLRQCSVPLLEPGDGRAEYRVRLGFCDPDNDQPGQRVFDVKLQAQTVLENLDVAKEAGGRDRALVKEFDGVEVDGDLRIELVAKTSTPAPRQAPLLQTIEVIRTRVTSLGCAVPRFQLSDLGPKARSDLQLANFRRTDFDGTLRISAPKGLTVEPTTTSLRLPSGRREALPVEVSVAKGVAAGNYPLKLVLLRGDGSVELERMIPVEHLGRRERLVVPACEDAGVHARYPDVNKGDTAVVFVDGGSSKMGDEAHALTYLKFRFDVPGKPASVSFRIQDAGNPSGDAGRICLVDGPWSEKTLTYQNRPQAGREVGRIGPVAENELVVRPLHVDLGGKKELSLVLDPTSCDGIDYLTREGGKPAELVIEYEPR